MGVIVVLLSENRRPDVLQRNGEFEKRGTDGGIGVIYTKNSIPAPTAPLAVSGPQNPQRPRIVSAHLGHDASQRRVARPFHQSADAGPLSRAETPGSVHAGHSDQNAVRAGPTRDVPVLPTPAGFPRAERAGGGAPLGVVLPVALDGAARIPAEKGRAGGHLEALSGLRGGVEEGEGKPRAAATGRCGLPATGGRAEATRAAEGGRLAGNLREGTRGGRGERGVRGTLGWTEGGRVIGF